MKEIVYGNQKITLTPLPPSILLNPSKTQVLPVLPPMTPLQQSWWVSIFFFLCWNHCLICNIKPHKKDLNMMKFVKTNIVNSWQAPSIWDLDQHWTWRMTKHGNRTNWKRVVPLFIPWKQALRVLKHRGIRKLRCSALKMQPLLKIGWGVLS